MNTSESSLTPFTRICLIGVGLIGGSFIQAIKQAAPQWSGHVVGIDPDPQALEDAKALYLIDEAAESLDLIGHTDLIVLAAPVKAIEAMGQDLYRYFLRYDTRLIDVGSVKGSVIQAIRNAFSGKAPSGYVPTHPIAGREVSGVKAALPGLFQGKRVIITPLAETDPKAVQQIESLWHLCGAKVVRMSDQAHDQIFAAVSHLPQLLAYALVTQLTYQEENESFFQNAGSGLRDMVRIAASDPVMWRDICLANGTFLIPLLDRLCEDLLYLKERMRENDATALESYFQKAKKTKDHDLL